jgi:hypothetical protein
MLPCLSGLLCAPLPLPLPLLLPAAPVLLLLRPTSPELLILFRLRWCSSAAIRKALANDDVVV